MKDIMIIGIAGGSGSGKTTLARNIAEHFGERISVLRHDDYYKAQSDISEAERRIKKSMLWSIIRRLKIF